MEPKLVELLKTNGSEETELEALETDGVPIGRTIIG
jgi:hypothetical protein